MSLATSQILLLITAMGAAFFAGILVGMGLIVHAAHYPDSRIGRMMSAGGDE